MLGMPEGVSSLLLCVTCRRLPIISASYHRRFPPSSALSPNQQLPRPTSLPLGPLVPQGVFCRDRPAGSRLTPAHDTQPAPDVPSPHHHTRRCFLTSVAMCLLPTVPQGVSGYVAVYDLQSGARVGRVDIRSVAVEMAFAPDGSVLVVVVQVGRIAS